MALDYLPGVHASNKRTRTLTLGELRELVEAAALLPPETIVRGNAVPFKMSDLGNVKGGCLMSVALDKPEGGD